MAENTLTTSRPLQRQFLNAILSSTNLRVYLVDHDMKFAYANKAALHANGYERRPANWEVVDAILKRTDKATAEELIDNILQCFLNGEVSPEKLMPYQQDEEPAWAQVTLTPIYDDGAVVYVAIMARDVTEAVMRGEERRRLVGSLLQAAEEERQRISHDLHDDILQEMTAMLFQADSLRRQAIKPEVIEGLEKLSATIHGAIERTRSLMFELHPAILEHAGVGPAVVELATKVLDEMSPIPHFTAKLEVPRTDPLVEATCFRIVREALVNIRKHSKAKNVDIALWIDEGRVQGQIFDDGRGFDYEKWQVSRTRLPGFRHFGLATLVERVRLAGGESTIDTKPGKGVRVAFWIPDEPLPQPT